MPLNIASHLRAIVDSGIREKLPNRCSWCVQHTLVAIEDLACSRHPLSKALLIFLGKRSVERFLQSPSDHLRHREHQHGVAKLAFDLMAAVPLGQSDQHMKNFVVIQYC